MTEPQLVRRLTTIMDIDVVAFSSMSARNEEHALSLLGKHMATAQTLIKHHRGRIFKLTGDGLLAEFVSPVEAVRSALEIQEAMRSANGQAGADDQMMLRIGINLGDVVESGDDLLGDAVNVAARLESIATPGGICVSSAVYEQIEGKLMLGAQDMGAQHVKNIPRPIHAYRLTIDGGQLAPQATVTVAAPGGGAPAAAVRKSSRLGVAIGAVAVLAVLAGGSIWFLNQHPASSPAPSQMAQSSAAAPTSPAAAPPAAPIAATSAEPTTAAEAAGQPPAPAPPSVTVEKRPYVASEVPFIPYWRQAPLEDYATAEDFKALALNVRGWYGIATRHVDVDSARRDALDECEALVAREVPVRREYDRCMLYAVGNDVVWSFRPPPMPPAPFVPAQKLSPPVAMNPATIPLIGDIARRNLTEHYLTANHSRAFVLGHGHFNWWTPNDNEADAIRRNLQMCGHITGRPCVIYAVDNNVIVRVPRLHRIVNVFTPEDIVEADPTQDEALERYLIANDWRALAVSDNRRIGIAFGRADEAGAVKDAMGDCIKAGGTGCTIKAVGPFLVEPL